MTKTSTRKMMREIKTSLIGSSFRRVQQDGRVTFLRNITTLGQLPSRSRLGISSAKVRRADSV